tara:strand:- start:830 stop:1909 length:1080 start_codon:yes stop_codon:yes gene_type:complete
MREVTFYIHTNKDGSIEIFIENSVDVQSFELKFSGIYFNFPINTNNYLTSDTQTHLGKNSAVKLSNLNNILYYFNLNSSEKISHSNGIKKIITIPSSKYHFLSDNTNFEICISSSKYIKSEDRSKNLITDSFCEQTGVRESASRNCKFVELVKGDLNYRGNMCNLTNDSFWNFIDILIKNNYREWFDKYDIWLTGSFAHYMAGAFDEEPKDIDLVIVNKDPKYENYMELQEIIKTFTLILWEEINVLNDVYYISNEVWPKRVASWEKMIKTNDKDLMKYNKQSEPGVTEGITYGKTYTKNKERVRTIRPSQKINDSTQLYKVNSRIISKKQASRLEKLPSKSEYSTKNFIKINKLVFGR